MCLCATQSHCAIFLEAVLIYWPYLNKDRLKALNKLILLFESFNGSESQLLTLLHPLAILKHAKELEVTFKIFPANKTKENLVRLLRR